MGGVGLVQRPGHMRTVGVVVRDGGSGNRGYQQWMQQVWGR